VLSYFLNSKKICIKNISFDIKKTFECGQCFRWQKLSENSYKGVAFSKSIVVSCEKDQIFFENTSENNFKNIWIKYFDLNTNYSEVEKCLLKFYKTLRPIIKYSEGIRILKQDPWETLCSFIISQNNNIPRIKAIIKALCENFGDKINNETYTFPEAYKLANLSQADLKPLRCGFRYKYIIDAARKISKKEIILEDLSNETSENIIKTLTKISGVGPKIANCVLLYGYNRLNAFPIDTWIKKALKTYRKLDLNHFYAGIIQQYIYYYIKSSKVLP
jgi:N-glycosylase/DNA lyase